MSYEVIERIGSLRQGAEAVTGETYNDLTEAVQGLKNGYGQGEEDNGDIIPLLEGTIEEITIPNEVTNLAGGVFGGCANLKEINVNENHSTYVSVDGILYTEDMKKLVSYPPAKEATEYIMPDSIEEIEGFAFNNTTNLENVIVSDNIKIFPKNLGISNKEAEIMLVLDSNVLSEGGVYPIGNEGINAVTIPEGSTYLSATVFDILPNIKSVYYNAECEFEQVGISNGKSIQYYNALHLLPNLKKIEVGGSVKNIPDNFIYSPKSGLDTLIISDSVETIGDKAFYYTNVSKEFKLGNNVKSIGFCAFNSSVNTDTLIIPDSVVELVEKDEYGSINSYAFQGCNFSNLVIGKGLTKLGGYVFSSCQKLQNVIIPSNIKTIGCNAFYHCTNLTEVQIENGVETIGDYAFSYCIALTHIDIPSSVKSIGYYAFGPCYALTEVRIEEGVEEIGESAFEACSSLTDIYIPRSVTSIGNFAFSRAGDGTENGLTIHGYAGSYAETYATDNYINFEAISE